jgi:hypothetical protein
VSGPNGPRTRSGTRSASYFRSFSLPSTSLKSEGAARQPADVRRAGGIILIAKTPSPSIVCRTCHPATPSTSNISIRKQEAAEGVSVVS